MDNYVAVTLWKGDRVLMQLRDNDPDIYEPNKWNLIQGTEIVGIFTRKIIFDKVSRDPSTQNIENTYNSFNNDANTRKVTVTVIWPEKTVNLITYFTNWK